VDIELQYTTDNTIPGTRSTTELWTTVTEPVGNNVLTRDVLTDHLEAAKAMTAFTVTLPGRDNIEFDMKDICRSGGADYIIQCTRVTVLDCYAEGRYDLPTSPAPDAFVESPDCFTYNTTDPAAIVVTGGSVNCPDDTTTTTEPVNGALGTCEPLSCAASGGTPPVTTRVEKNRRTQTSAMAFAVVADPTQLGLLSNTVEGLRETLCPTADVNGDGTLTPVYNWGKAYPLYGIPENAAPPIVEDSDGNPMFEFKDDGSPTPIIDQFQVLCAILDGLAVPLEDGTAVGQPGLAYVPYGRLAGQTALPYTIKDSDIGAGAGPYTVLTLPTTGAVTPGYNTVNILQFTTVKALIEKGLVFQGDFGSDGVPNSRGLAYYIPEGAPNHRPSFLNPATTQEAIQKAGTTGQVDADGVDIGCKFWDNGAVLPTIPRDIVLGQEDRLSDPPAFQAIEFVVYAVEAETLAQRVKSPYRSPALGGPISDLTVEEAQTILDDWRVRFTEQIPAAQETGGTRHNAFSSDSFDLILTEFSDASLPLVLGGYLILIVYAFFALRRSSTKCDKVLIMSKSMVGGAGVLVVALGVGGGLGLACYAGIPLNATSTQVLPFLLLGLGVDDMFVIAHNIDEDFDTDVPVLIGQLMAVVGPSITLTSGVNAIAFSIGTLTPLPVVIDFALQAAISICVLYGINLFVFPALLALNEYRMRANRVDCLPCMTRADFQREERSGKEGFVKDVILNRFYLPFLKSVVGKIVVFVTFGIIFAIGVYGASEKVVLGLSIADVAPAGTQEYEWLTVRYGYFSFYDMQIVVQGDGQGFDYTQIESQQRMIELFEQVSDTTHAVDDGQTWLHAFLQFGFPDHGLALDGTWIENPAYQASNFVLLQNSFMYTMCTFAAVGNMTPEQCKEPNTFAGFKHTLELQICAGTLGALAQAGVADAGTCLVQMFGPDPYDDYSGLLGQQLANSLTTEQTACIANYCSGPDSAHPFAPQPGIDVSVFGQMTEADYISTVNGMIGQNAALGALTNPNCDPGNPLTPGVCGPHLGNTIVSDAGDASTSGCTSIFSAAVEGIDLDYQGGPSPTADRTNPSALCLNLGPAGLQCFTIEPDFYYQCMNAFAQNSRAAALTGPYWSPDTGILGGGSVCDPDRVEGCEAGDPRLIGEVGGEGSPLVFSEYSMYSNNLVDNEDYVRLIEEVRDVCSTSPVPAYPKGTGFLYWEQYIGLQETLFFNIIYALIAVFFVTFFMLLVVPKVEREKLWTLIAAAAGGSSVLIFVLALYMIEIYGFMGWMDIKLSALPAVSLIMAVGVGVEFTAHIILAFILAEGDRNDRMEAAMDHMFLPTIDGTISTFLVTSSSSSPPLSQQPSAAAAATTVFTFYVDMTTYICMTTCGYMPSSPPPPPPPPLPAPQSN
jgi:hypothetical protein